MSTREVDVVVLGCGAAGAAVALAAARGGAEVLVVERQAPARHTPNVRMSGGLVMTLVDAGEGVRYLSACAGGLVDDALLRPWADRAVGLEKWLADIGVVLHLPDANRWGLSRGTDDEPASWAEHPGIAGSASVRASHAATELPAPFPGRGHQVERTGEVRAGEAIYRGLMHALARQAVEIWWETDTSELVRDEVGGPVRGIRARKDATTLEVRARRGVVLATGGFGADPEMVRQFLAVPNTKFYGNPGNDGSGIKLAMAVGADLVRMNRMVGRGIASVVLDDGDEVGFMMNLRGGRLGPGTSADAFAGGVVLCDQEGRRYADEYDLAQQSHAFYYQLERFDPHRVAYTRSPSYLIFDERRRTAGPMTYHDRGASAFGIYDWSEDNETEIGAGWITRADTPGAAAAAAGAEPAAAAAVDQAVAEYNEAIAAGRPDALGRPADSTIPLDRPPYYCIPMYCGGPYTMGGPRRDELGRVLDVRGAVIPGLFAAGEAGQAIGLLYPTSGASISEALCFGTIIGEHLAGAS